MAITKRIPFKGLMCLILVLCIGISQVGATGPAVFFARFLVQYFLSKVLDQLWDASTGAPDLGALSQQLHTVEVALAKVDTRLSLSIQELRKDLDSRVTKAEVRGIVEMVLARLDARIETLDYRMDQLEFRVAELEEVFGFVTTAPPAPLIRDAIDGTPRAHPLLGEWMSLLARSEATRLRLTEVKRLYTRGSEALADARDTNEGILEETRLLREKINQQLFSRLKEREVLLRNMKPAHPRIRDFDVDTASLTWLVAVARPAAPDGRLAIPKALLTPKSSEILQAMQLAGEDVTLTVPLFRQILPQIRGRSRAQPAIDTTPLSAQMRDLYRETMHFVSRAEVVAQEAATAEQRIASLLEEYTASHPDIQALHATKAALLRRIRGLYTEADDLLNRALAEYVRTMVLERISNARMTTFRRGVLYPLHDYSKLFSCDDWTLGPRIRETWERVVRHSAPYYKKNGAKSQIGRNRILSATSGLRAHYPFDLNLRDATNSNHAIGESVSFVRGMRGAAAWLTGNSRIVIQNPEILPPRNFTINLWARFDSLDGYSSLLDKREYKSGINSLELYLHDELLMFSVLGSSLATRLANSTVPLKHDTWHMISCVLQGDRVFLYVNGQLAAQERFEGPIQQSRANLWLGARLKDGDFAHFKGLLDDVRIYDRALSDAEIKYLGGWLQLEHNSAEFTGVPDSADRRDFEGLVSYFCFDDGVFECSRGFQVHGVGVEFGPGLSGNGLKLNEDGAAAVLKEYSLSLLHSFTVEIWVRTTGGDDGRVIIATPAWALRIKERSEKGRVVFDLRTKTDSSIHEKRVASKKGIADNRFHQIVATFDGDSMKLYLDGRLQSTRRLGGFVFGSTVPVVIGNEIAEGDEVTEDSVPFRGEIDEVRIFRRALTKSQVRSFYDRGRSATVQR